MVLSAELMRRFFAKVGDETATGCWHWMAANNGRKNYGVFSLPRGVHKRHWLAHRLSWTWTYGPIPTGLQVCHKCDNVRCVNPLHMFLGTNADNMLDCHRKGRARGLTSATNKPALKPVAPPKRAYCAAYYLEHRAEILERMRAKRRR